MSHSHSTRPDIEASVSHAIERALASLSKRARDELGDTRAVAAALHAPILEACQRWPDLRPTLEGFARRLLGAGRRDGGRWSREGLRVADLYLAHACLEHDPAALSVLDEQLMPRLSGALRRMRFGAADVDDVLQEVRKDLLLAQDGKTPLLARYSGSGQLHSWLRVTTVRRALRRRRASREAPGLDEDDRVARRLDSGQIDPEIRYLKEAYRGPFRQAFGEALRGLPSKQQNVIRYYFVDELTTAQIGRIYGVHQSTAHRWLEAAQRALLQQIRQRLATRLQMTPDECDSVIRLVKSHLGGTVVSMMRVDRKR